VGRFGAAGWAMRLTAGVLRRLSSLLALVASSAVLVVRTVVAASLAVPPPVPVAVAVPLPEPEAAAVIGGPGPTTPAPHTSPAPSHALGGTYLPATPPLCIDTPPPTGTVTPSPHKPSKPRAKPHPEARRTKLAMRTPFVADEASGAKEGRAMIIAYSTYSNLTKPDFI